MKIWIHIDGVQEGPYEIEDLPLSRMKADTPVWYEGLADWTQAIKAPATAALFGSRPELIQDKNTEVNNAVNFNSNYANANNGFESAEKCPPTFFVWSILLTVLCCNPIGIIPIITGALTLNKYRNHDFNGAKRMSNTTEWWVIITIVTSLIMLPLAILMQAI